MHALILSLALSLRLASLAQGFTADQIIDRHVAARGGAERIAAVRTLVFSGGTYREGTFVGSGGAFMAFERPYFRVVGNPEDRKASILEGYDGSAWEYYADPGVVVRTIGHAAGATRRGTSIDWRLGEFRANGAKVERGPDETIDGRAAYRIIVTTPDGFARDSFIDQENFLLLADRYHAPVHAVGESVKTEGRFSDWRDVEGIRIPFRVVEVDLATGKELNSMTWSKVEINRELPASWFTPPQYSRTRLQTLLEQLYMERSDPVAVRWTYEEFRRVHPDVDVSKGIEFIARQMKKMGDGAEAAEWLVNQRP